MARRARLQNISGKHYKYYYMDENDDGTFTATYGRIGSRGQRHTYPMHKWDEIYRQKLLNRGYSDVTDHKVYKGIVVHVLDTNDRGLVTDDRNHGGHNTFVKVLLEKGHSKMYRRDEVTPVFFDPDNALHAMVYPRLCKAYRELHDDKEEESSDDTLTSA